MNCKTMGVEGNDCASHLWKGEKMKKRKIVLLLTAVVLIVCSIIGFTACNKEGETDLTIRVSTTTSVNDSGLMDYLTPYFEKDTGYKLEIASAGTGAAINAAKYGNADIILVHSKSQEDVFVADGYGRKVGENATERVSFMYNYFVLVGPTADPANTKDAATILAAFANIASSQSKFISRGDKSGTHTKEVSLWDSSLNITSDVTKLPQTTWYVSAASSMGACLTMANEQNGYVLTDKATYLAYKNNTEGDKIPNLTLLYEQDNSLKNTYTMIAVNPDANFVNADGNALEAGSVKVNTKGADVFLNWMTGEHAKALIAFYGTTDYGAPLFYLI